MKSHTLDYRMRMELNRGFEYISIWGLTQKEPPAGLRVTLFSQHSSCRKYRSLLPLLKELSHVTFKHLD